MRRSTSSFARFRISLALAALGLAACNGAQSSPGLADGGHTDGPGTSAHDVVTLGDGGTTLTLSAPYTIPAGTEVTYECFRTTIHSSQTRYVDSFNPHLAQGTHHVVLFVDPSPSQPDGVAPCFFMDSSSQRVLYAAGIGANETLFPTNVGYPLNDGDQLILQLHELNAGTGPLSETTTLDIGLMAPGATVTPAQVTFVGNVFFTIPPGPMGGYNYTVKGTCSSLPAGSHVFAVFPHMHQLGVST